MRSIHVTALLLAFVITLVEFPSTGAALSDDADFVLVGKTKRVIDGDTIRVVLDSGPITVRLASIDAPEHNQPFGKQATSQLRDLVAGRTIQLSPQGQDRYERLVAVVYVDGMNANAELVRRGAAWAYTQYLTDRNLPAIEAEARREKLGLWASNDAVAPWEFRHREKQVDKGDEVEDDAPQETPFKCGTKRTCGEMTSCEEAQFFFKPCDVRSLDGDADGVPCDNLCQ